MFEKFIYMNHVNESLEFGTGGLYVNQSDLRDFAWEITSKNDKISGFKKGIVTKTLPVIIKCRTEAEGIELRNKIFEVSEKDVLTNKHGKIMIGNYYLRCFITGSKKTEYLIHKSYMLVELTVTTDFPAWIKETKSSFGTQSGGTEEFLDFFFDFPFDFKNGLVNNEINNTNFVASDFIITIYGYISNPTLYIAGHEYTVNVDVEDGEFLTIDSVNKKIYLVKNNGTVANCFNARNRDSYIFEKIPAGINDIVSPNLNIAFDIVLLEERSEPKWI